MRRTLGISFIELLVAALIIGLVLTGLLQAFTVMHNAHRDSNLMPAVNSDLTDVVNRIAGEIRKAPLCSSAAGCDLTANGNIEWAAIKYAQPSAIKVYTLQSGSFASYYLSNDGTTLYRNTLTNDLTTPLTGDSINLQLRYFVNPTGTHFSSYDPGDPDDANNPNLAYWTDTVSTAASMLNIAAVKISLTLRRSDYTNSYSTIVRLRNSPKFVKGMD